MNLKTIVALILIISIIFGIMKIMGTLNEKRQETTSSYLQETVGLQKKAKELTRERARQIEKEEQIMEE